uniref:Succinate dehydrogenase assembly factor 4, mitochondrial n=1 Tax=Oryza glumipatula TaxID=40148 RepID=A0A0E0A5C2_9ORYZ
MAATSHLRRAFAPALSHRRAHPATFLSPLAFLSTSASPDQAAAAAKKGEAAAGGAGKGAAAGEEEEEKKKGGDAGGARKEGEDGGGGGGGGEYVNKDTGEIGGPRGPEPTRYGDWERGGRCSDF